MPRRKTKLQNTELLTRKEAAAYLGVAEQTLAVWACTKRNNLPVIKVGRLSKYRRTDLDFFLNSNTVSARTVINEATTLKLKAPPERSKNRIPLQQAIDFAEVQIVDHKTHRKTSAIANAAELEIVLPRGITLRLAPGGSLDFLVSVVAALENP